ncbi:MAG TPA: gamma carbonic anhydrase family protein [Bryobacteraceae bacterium]|nr:gamma carbonic anhydrase family protein [Bryobacteraceae bacterium]
MIRSHRGKTPKIAVSAYIDPSATVIGDVEIGERSSVWPSVSIRADINAMHIGEETNIQENSVLHSDEGFPLTIGDRVTVGHGVMLHGCTLEDDVVVGIGAIVLNGAKVGKGAAIAAAALVTEGMEIFPGTLVMGVPAKPRREVTETERERFHEGWKHYVDRGQICKREIAADVEAEEAT